ncbi:hypothetical protein [Agrobacterium genomosp. 2]|uniref:Uncharacterized protein n=1 Tax=Agrobacterium genomosp. 2 str. CFBP 5494 TaxID=1183436 RepID=A0A9W5F109_9HYPH|nr:hypothetical protein [Agrobacterium genomosp. 2]CUW93691.1 hypothetical protein AGR2A_Cc70085 [Agrobacterium genomosp. 2 str. CFBP 5494]
MTAPRRRFGLPPLTIHVESMDIEELVNESLHRQRDMAEILDLYDFGCDETISRIGWHMSQRTGSDFRIGRRILQLMSKDSYLMPPPEFRLSRQTEPTEEDMFRAPIVTPYRVELWQSGSTPAEWRVHGSVYHRDWEPRIWSRLLFLNRQWGMALTDDGWVRLGRRI